MKHFITLLFVITLCAGEMNAATPADSIRKEMKHLKEKNFCRPTIIFAGWQLPKIIWAMNYAASVNILPNPYAKKTRRRKPRRASPSCIAITTTR